MYLKLSTLLEMDNKKFIGTKRRSLIEDPFDDSFEIFLPNKLKEKSIICQTNLSSRNSNRKKKSSPISSTSSTSQESFNTEMEQVVAQVCLAKDKSLSSANVAAKEVRNKNWKELKHKMKRQPLLMSRTTAEREAILSQKLAVILVEDNEDNDSTKSSYSLVDMENLIQSDHLLQLWCKSCRLWSAAKLQSLQIKDYYLAGLSNYIKISETWADLCSASYKDVSFTFNFEKPREPHKSNYEILKETATIEDSSLVKDDCAERKLDDQSVDIFDDFQTEVESFNPDDVDLPDITSKIDNSKIIDSSNVIRPNCTSGIEAIPAEIIELASSPSSDRSVQLHHTFKNQESPVIYSPAHSISSVVTEKFNKQLGMLDRIGVTFLVQQWENLFNTNEGDITVLLDNDATINVHTFVLNVRCQTLIYEISEGRLLWDMYSLEAAKAFFRYIYTGKCDHLWYLTSLDKATVKRLARLYQLNHLEENSVTNSVDQHLIKNKKDDNNAIIEASNEEIYDAINDNDPYEYVRRSLSPYECVNISQSDLSVDESVPHSNVRKSLEGYFQESFPDMPNLSGLSTSADLKLTVKEVNMQKVQTQQECISLSESSDSVGDGRDIIDSPLISSQSPESWTSFSSTDKISAPSFSPNKKSTFSTSFSQPNFQKKSASLQLTPSCSSSEIYFSKSVTPFPDYDSMITPQLKRELKKYGLKGNLGSTKAKVLLKYIYDQIHPVVESDKEQEINPTQTQSSSSEIKDSLTTYIGNIIKSNQELYTHILLFKPIWFENFYQLLKEQGIVCSANQLKDALNTLGITYRTKNTRNIKQSKKSKRKRRE
ncbi:uncharacterized protein isoform X2 [Rhodnius prolixus]|uniref:uncharacterized protein isoform X2 n=1 Tax=Rhodnius prolixus TaxID=13249 RepID=UPI003D18FAC9